MYRVLWFTGATLPLVSLILDYAPATILFVTSFSVRIPFAGEAVSVFKTVSDLFSYSDPDSTKITRLSDDTVALSLPLTVGVFRLLLDGQCEIVDRDFDNQVSLMVVTAKDRGGKGKLDARVRLSLEESKFFGPSNGSCLVLCECDVTMKGMLTRVPFPLADVMSSKIEAVLAKIINESEKAIVIDGFEDADQLVETLPEHIDPSILASLLEGGKLDPTANAVSEQPARKPLWIIILQFPANVLLWPLSLLRNLLNLSL